MITAPLPPSQEEILRENERLRAEVEMLKAGNDAMRHTLHQWQPGMDALRAEVERLRAALEWYADHDNYRLLDFSNDMSAVDLDSGTRARAALNTQEKT